jgi:hypothetical protein
MKKPRKPTKPRSPIQWTRVRGDELVEGFNGERVEDGLVPEVQALYCWKRAFRAPSGATASAETLLEWIEEIIAEPTAAIEHRELTHYAVLEKLVLRGAPLSEDKAETLRDFLGPPQNRRWMKGFLDSLVEHAPPLYVGQTGRLPHRVAEHMKGESGFGEKVEASGTNWTDLDLFYLPLGQARATDDTQSSSMQKRTALEMLMTSLTIAGFVDRRG